MKLPNINDDHVTQFCKIFPSSQIEKIKYSPSKDSEKADCFNIIENQMNSHGGKQVLGWAIWEWPNVMIEAEFHSIWQSPNGELLDLTPRPVEFEHIVFVRDPSKSYKGRQVNNIRKPLANSLTVKKYIDTANKIYKEMNKGELANFHGEMEATPTLIKLYKKMAQLQGKLTEKYGSPY